MVAVSVNGRGLLAAVLAFVLWGVLPIYWKHLAGLNPISIVAQRTIWTCIVVWPLLLWRGRLFAFERGVIGWHMISGLLIGGNWVLYVWATLNDRMLEGALGYYINPFFNMLFGALWFGERQNRLQLVAILAAFGGVLLQMPGVGHFPWVGITLGITFSMYAVVKKRAKLGALEGLTVESSLLVPLALGWLVWQSDSFPEAFGGSLENGLLLAGTGIATASPLLLFAFASQRIRLGTLGMLQFIGPTLQFIIGWRVYGEPMTEVRLMSFGLIWLAIGLYAMDGILRRRNERNVVLADGARGG